MEFAKQINHVSWLLSASLEQMRLSFREIKQCGQNSVFQQDKNYQKVIYHLNLAITLLKQVEKGYSLHLSQGRIRAPFLVSLKNTYVQRSIFNLRMSFDYLKESKKTIESYSTMFYQSLFQKLYTLDRMMNTFIHHYDQLLRMIKE